jgi:uncharacterized membrane protein YeaQ/YmgE (transglycosylase-associated protein family)
MSGESLLIILLVGIVAGWLAGQIVQGTGFGLIGDLIVGVIGAFTLVAEAFGAVAHAATPAPSGREPRREEKVIIDRRD